MIDFTFEAYKLLLKNILDSSYKVKTVAAYFDKPENFSFILRHDVDRYPNNALKMASIEYEMGIESSYYFRIDRETFDEKIIGRISNMGHEIGYHYEDIDIAFKKAKLKHKRITDDVLIDLALESFINNLKEFRKYYPVKTICMHGSPMSSYDNRLLWSKYNYRDYGIIGEPYIDIDFNEVLYLTDTGRRWNSNSVNVRDKVDSNFNYNFKSTSDIIQNLDSLPPKIMFNIHPQRWHDSALPWLKELIGQNVKNVGKFILAKSRKRPD